MSQMDMNKVISVGLGKAGAIDVDLAKLAKSQAVMEYVFHYGLKQMLNDVHASEKDAAAKLGLSQKKLDSLYRGEIAQARVGGGGDEVAREMRKLAEAELKAKLAKLGRKLKDFSKDQLQAGVEALLKANEAEYRKTAEAKLALKPAAAKDVDIMALLG